MAEIESRVISDLEVLRLLAWHPIRVISGKSCPSKLQNFCRAKETRWLREGRWDSESGAPETAEIGLWEAKRSVSTDEQLGAYGALEESMKHCKSWSQGCLNLIVSHWQENFLHSVRRRLAWHGVQSLDTQFFFWLSFGAWFKTRTRLVFFSFWDSNWTGPFWVHCFLVFSRTFGLSSRHSDLTSVHVYCILLHSTAFRLVDLRFYLSM